MIRRATNHSLKLTADLIKNNLDIYENMEALSKAIPMSKVLIPSYITGTKFDSSIVDSITESVNQNISDFADGILTLYRCSFCPIASK